MLSASRSAARSPTPLTRTAEAGSTRMALGQLALADGPRLPPALRGGRERSAAALDPKRRPTPLKT